MHHFYIPSPLQFLDGATFSMSEIIDVEVDPENAWFRVINSCLINMVTHSIVRFFSTATSIAARIPTAIEKLGCSASGDRTLLSAVTFESPPIVSAFWSSAFVACSGLEWICIPASVRYIRRGCLLFCDGLVSVTFEHSSLLEEIDDVAFNSCKSLTQISIPASVRQIGRQCFVACESLASITFEPPLNLEILSDLGDLIVPQLEIPDSVRMKFRLG
jgi:hypothetical protein